MRHVPTFFVEKQSICYLGKNKKWKGNILRIWKVVGFVTFTQLIHEYRISLDMVFWLIYPKCTYYEKYILDVYGNVKKTMK
jgi:hypothetical protein